MLVLVDMDGVLADFEAAFLAAWRHNNPSLSYVEVADRDVFYVKDQYPLEHRELVHAVHGVEGFFRSLPPVEGALVAMEEMASAGLDVFICTAPLTSNLFCASEKHAWVQEHLGKPWLKRTVVASDKTLVRGDFLVDDRPLVDGLLTPTWQHVVFGAPYNQSSPSPRMESWASWRESLMGAGWAQGA